MSDHSAQNSAARSPAFETARDFAEHGHPVFPTHSVANDGRCSCGRACSTPAKHPRTPAGFKDATTDERTLLAWDTRWPDANWAVACGESFAVVDIDPKHGADPHEVIAAHELAGAMVRTGEALDGPLMGTRGLHIYFAGSLRTGDSPVPGVDIRGEGSYVMLPGSRHVSGVSYEWDNGRRPWGKLAPVPAALHPRRAENGAAPAVEGDITTNRNVTLTSLAGSMRSRGMSEAALLAALLVENQQRCKPPLDDDEVRTIARSVGRYQPTPRTTVFDSQNAKADDPPQSGSANGNGASDKDSAPDTATLLATVGQLIRRFVILPSPAGYRAVELFVMHTWAFRAAHATPYIVVESPEKQSGKSRLLEVLELVCRDSVKVASISAAGLFQTVGENAPTLLIDEADAIFAGSSERSEDLRGVLNAGNAPGSKVIRGGKSGKPDSYDVFCPKVIAGIATGRLPDTIRDRSIVVPIDRKLRAERVERLRPRRLREELVALRSLLASWAEHNHDELFEFDLPTPMEKISDRLEEAWEPLLAIASLAGDDWMKTGRDAAEKLASGDVEDGDSSSHQALAALRGVFAGKATMTTKDITAALNGSEELPFGGWNDGKGISARELGRLLKRYRVTPKALWVDGRTLRGYRRADFQEAWDRYAEPVDESSTESARTTTESTPVGGQNPSQGVSDAILPQDPQDPRLHKGFSGVSHPQDTPDLADGEGPETPVFIRGLADLADKTRPTGSDGVSGHAADAADDGPSVTPDGVCAKCGSLVVTTPSGPVCHGCLLPPVAA